MNKRIKELLVQSGLLDYTKIIVPEQEKFAELIVKECAELVDRAISDGGVDGRVLKQHFGVES